jgi:hypothetical protein
MFKPWIIFFFLMFPLINAFHGCKVDLFDLADSMSVWNLLREFRIRQVHMAVVLNEYGGTIGVCQKPHPLNSLLLQNKPSLLLNYLILGLIPHGVEIY